jgi:hypothetical protein
MSRGVNRRYTERPVEALMKRLLDRYVRCDEEFVLVGVCVWADLRPTAWTMLVEGLDDPLVELVTLR